MSASFAMGLLIIAAELACLAVGLFPVLRGLHRATCDTETEWARVMAAVDAARADIDIELWEKEMSA